MAMKSKNKTSDTMVGQVKKAANYLKSHKTIAMLLFVVLLVIGNFAYNKYQDWDNAQTIKGLARDFPILVEQIERETGLDLEIQSNCMTTTEKFSEGVRTCEWLVVENPVSQEALNKQNKVFESQATFSKSTEFPNKEGYEFKYRNKNSCEFSYEDYIYTSCITGVRDANVPKIKELLAN